MKGEIQEQKSTLEKFGRVSLLQKIGISKT